MIMGLQIHLRIIFFYKLNVICGCNYLIRGLKAIFQPFRLQVLLVSET